MREQKLASVLIALSVDVLMGACQSAPAAPAAELRPGLANPASAHCEEQGGNLEMRQVEIGGSSGYVSLPMALGAKSGLL